MNYYKGCTAELEHDLASKERAVKIAQRLHEVRPGIEVRLFESAKVKGVVAKSALVPHGHPLSNAGTVDANGKLLESLGARLLLGDVESAIAETP